MPLGVLLEPMVMTALRAGVAEARPAARFVRRVVLEVGLGGGPTADRAGAGGVPDLGQVPELDPGIMTLASNRWSHGSVVIGSTVMIRSGPGPGVRSRQVPYPPGGLSRPAGVKENPSSPGGGPGPARLRVALGFGAGAAVGDGVPLAVGDRQAPGGLRIGRGGGGQVPGQPRVHRAEAAELTGPVRQAGQGGQRDSQGDPRCEPGGHGRLRAAPAPSWRGRESLPSSRSR